MSKQLNFTSGLVRDWVPVTPSDSTDNVKSGTFDRVVGFVATADGNIAVVNYQGTTRTIPVQAGVPVPFVDATRVKATGTTATGIFSLVI